MPIKKDADGKRWVEMEFIAPGTPEQIWHAMATGPGNEAWFTKASIEERVGGALRFHFGPDLSSSGEVTAWEPPRHFAYVERDWSEGAPPVATEITITPRAGGQCVVRMVHSLFSSSDSWDDQMEGFENGWPGFFEVLKIYLAHFAGMKGSAFQAMVGFGGELKGDPLDLWSRLTTKLQLAGANVGERRTTPAQPEALSGTVEWLLQNRKVRVLLLRLESSPGVALIGTYSASHGVHASVSIFFYGDDAEKRVEESEPKWRSWLQQAMTA